ncbi:hypothetical protein [Streptomyces sp. NPDC050856]|uniref:hypothetical protein n=1 Tax=Streptomyces sp. NPDC050856 TaxID=3154939 RepID=UPI0033E5E60C
MNLRMIGLGAVVVFTALLPLAAAAGPAGSPGSEDDAGPGPSAPERVVRTAPGRAAPEGAAPALPVAERAGSSQRSSRPGLLAGSDAPSAATARCGPELASPHGVEAQTCVLTEGPDTWARTYYRNATGGGLTAVLTQMGPGGRTVQTRCAVPADDEPGTCETPREATRGPAGAYTAVAEFAASGGRAGSVADAESPLLLRSGSNSPDAVSR